MFYVYLDFTDDGRVFYVGKGSGRRALEYRRNKKHTRIRKTFGCKRKIVFQSLSEEDVFRKETALVEYFNTFTTDWKTGIACNFTRGGDGARGAIRSEETREKISANNERTKESRQLKCSINNAMRNPVIKAKVVKSITGVPKSPSHRAALSKAKMGSPPTRGTTGMKMELESKDKMSKTRKGIPKNGSHRENIKNAVVGTLRKSLYDSSKIQLSS